MKVTVERAQLLKSLGHVHRVVERRNTIPILGNVLVRAENTKLALKATDLDLEVTETLAAETGTGGSTTVPAHMFYDIVRKLPDGAQIVLEADGDRSVLAIRAGRSLRQRQIDLGEPVTVGGNRAQGRGFGVAGCVQIDAVEVVAGFFGRDRKLRAIDQAFDVGCGQREGMRHVAGGEIGEIVLGQRL